MNSVRGRRKRKDIPENDFENTKKRVKVSKNGNSNSNDCFNFNNKSETKQNGIIDSNFHESLILNEEYDNINSHVENKSDLSVVKELALQSFHAKFSKSSVENTVPSDQCNGNKPFCFACKSKSDDVVKCSVTSCDKFYHSKCLEKLPVSKGETGACPLHLCLSCYNSNPKNQQMHKGPLYKCFKCPTAFHVKDECHIPGSIILTHERMSCPDHFSPEKHRDYPAVVNLYFCINCGCNTNLTYCVFCPLAIHKHCMRDGAYVDGKYICNRCETRQVISYNDIVWAKICNFRWWPAKVLNPKDLPSDVHKLKHFEGEFPVHFYETGEYFWTQKGRVFPFTYKNIGLEDDIIHNFKKQMQDVIFDNAVNQARQALQDKNLLKQTDLFNGKKPPPYKHIKVNRPIGNVQIYPLTEETDFTMCGCRPDDPNPCGYDTICLNRSMCTECIPNVCEAGDRCQNQKFQKRENASVKPFLTENRGWGLKSLQDIKAGHFVIEYVGDLIDEAECERRIQEKQAIGDNNFYFCTLDSTRIIDAGPKGNYSRFLNHSCDPNCETQKWIVLGDARVGVFAKKDIPAGSELTFDYKMDFSHFKKLICNCGASCCSGLIGKKPQNGTKNVPPVLKTQQPNNSKPTIKKYENSPKNKPVCFKCNKGGKLISCSLNSCKKSYHVRCITNISSSKPSSKNWECPSHFCKKCKSSSEYQCFACPNSYCKKHVDSTVLNNKTFACLKHSE